MRADIGMSWRNNGNEVIIEALCPKELQPKDLKCTFTTNTLILEVAGKEIATGKLFGPIKPDESTWQFGEPSRPCTDQALAGDALSQVPIPAMTPTHCMVRVMSIEELVEMRGEHPL